MPAIVKILCSSWDVPEIKKASFYMHAIIAFEIF